MDASKIANLNPHAPMSWVTVIWSMVAAACLTMALPHLIVGLRQRGAWVHRFFALGGFAVAWMAAILGFVHFYFGTGRLWLGVLACGLRALCLVVNFALPPNLNFRCGA